VQGDEAGNGTGWGVMTLNCRFYVEKSNARPPSATFYHTAIQRTKGLKRFEGKEGRIFAQETLKQAAGAQKEEGLSRINLFLKIS